MRKLKLAHQNLIFYHKYLKFKLIVLLFSLQALDNQFSTEGYSSKHFTKKKFSLKDKATIQCEIKENDKCTVDIEWQRSPDAKTKVGIIMFQHLTSLIILYSSIFFHSL